MALIKCLSFDKNVSDAATSCPHCGHPLRAVTIEKTGKKWKSIKLFSVLAILIGAVFSFLFGQSALWTILLIGGIFALIVGFVGSWWFHG